LPLVDDELGVRRPVQEALEMHCIMQDLLGLDDFVEAEVVMPLLECIESDVTIELPERMRVCIHIHF